MRPHPPYSYISNQLFGVRDVLCHGLVTKTVGSSAKQRVLVLTNTPLLVYMVPETGEVKGEIAWDDTVYARMVDGDHFEVRRSPINAYSPIHAMCACQSMRSPINAFANQCVVNAFANDSAIRRTRSVLLDHLSC